MKPKIYVLCGMIASSKSSYCKNAAKQGHIILNDDAIVNSLHADNYTLYNKDLKILYKSIENSILSLSLCFGKNVVVDRGLNISLTGRKRWLALAKSFDVKCEAIVFEKSSPEIHAQRRTNHDARGHTYTYWLNVATHHDSIYCEPSMAEGFDNVHHITFEEILSGKTYET